MPAASPEAPPTVPLPASPREGPSFLLVAFTALAMLAVTFGVTVAATRGSDSEAAVATAPSMTARVTLTEFAITPATITVASGGALHVTNSGSVAHNLTVLDQKVATNDLAPGTSADLDVSSLAPGTYPVVCLLPGHADAGMKATLDIVTAAAAGMADMPGMGAPAAAAGATSTTLDYATMTKDMLSTMAAFPAATKGVGNQILAPTEVRADGTKVFDLTMEQASWKVSPGKIVKASTFNGTVPGPRIDLQVGDHVQLRVKNAPHDRQRDQFSGPAR